MSNNQTIKPLFDYVLVKPEEYQTKTASGIVLPDSSKEKPQMGTVMAIGDGATTPEGKKTTMVVKVGDKILYKKWGGNEVKVENEEWILIEQKDVMAVMK